MYSRKKSVSIRIILAVLIFLYMAYVANKFVLSGRLPRFDFTVILVFVGLYFIWTIISETVPYQNPDVFMTEDDDIRSYVYLQIASMVALFYAAIDFVSLHLTRLYHLEPGIIYWGLGLFILTCGYRGWGMLAIGRVFNPRVAVSEGYQLITIGPYKTVRHPLYLGVFVSLIAIGMIFSSWGALLITFLGTLPALVYRVNLEEKFMLKHFGKQYEEYMKKSKKLIPGLW